MLRKMLDTIFEFVYIVFAKRMAFNQLNCLLALTFGVIIRVVFKSLA